MLTLIAGGNGSGKSRYAESLVAALDGPRYYIATMVSQSADNEARIAKHRCQRENLNFITVEEPWKVGKLPVAPDSVVLLEDVSNLLANLLFGAGGTAAQALDEIVTLSRRCRQLLLVTISGLDAGTYSGETADYIRALTWLNAELSGLCDCVFEMRNGIAVPVKKAGELEEHA